MCTAMYITVGTAGYLYAREATKGNILNNFSSNDPVVTLGRGGLLCTLMLALPLLVQPCRRSLNRILAMGAKAWCGSFCCCWHTYEAVEDVYPDDCEHEHEHDQEAQPLLSGRRQRARSKSSGDEPDSRAAAVALAASPSFYDEQLAILDEAVNGPGSRFDSLPHCCCTDRRVL